MPHRKKMIFNNLEISRVIIFIVSILILKSGFGELHIINGNEFHNPDSNLCPVQHRLEHTRYQTFMETYWKRGFWRDRIATRINVRTVIVAEWRRTFACCKGYVEAMETKEEVKCVSVCLSGCLHGMCNPRQPNECLCDNGYRASINNVTQYGECVPDCPGGCYGGECTAPFTCTCNFGQRLSKDQTKCESPCNDVGAGGIDGCGDNATCIAPDTCQCYDGYTIDITLSSPVDQSSINVGISATTVSLDHLDKRIFHHSNVTCKALCEPECDENAKCIAPNKCQCNTGYQFVSSLDDNKNSSVCVPVCEPTCRNGFCGYPNQCTCHPGYEEHSAHDFICIPVCDEPCINAKCTLPNHCECHDGYENLITKTGRHERVSETICVPICTEQCPNGSCIAPELCTCNLGYALTSQSLNEATVTVITDNNISFTSNTPNLLNKQSCQPLCQPAVSSSSPCITPYHCNFQHTVNFTEEHINNANESMEHDMCFCKYGWNGFGCTEISLCAIIFTEYNETDETSSVLQSTILTVEMIKMGYGDVFDDSSTPVRKWEGPKCKERCRSSILSLNIVGNKSEELISCYHFKLINETADYVIVSNSVAPLNSEEKNKTLVCFINAEFKCNAIEMEIFRHRVVEIVGGTVGVAAILVIIVGVILSMYCCQRKSSVPRRIKSNPDQAEAVECLFPTYESSTL